MHSSTEIGHWNERRSQKERKISRGGTPWEGIWSNCICCPSRERMLEYTNMERVSSSPHILHTSVPACSGVRLHYICHLGLCRHWRYFPCGLYTDTDMLLLCTIDIVRHTVTSHDPQGWRMVRALHYAMNIISTLTLGVVKLVVLPMWACTDCIIPFECVLQFTAAIFLCR